MKKTSNNSLRHYVGLTYRKVEFYYRVIKAFLLCCLPYKKSKSYNTQKKLVWFGAYGNTNIGDDLIFFSLRKYIPQNVKVMLSCRQQNPQTDYGVDTFYKFDIKKWKRIVKDGDYVWLGGGGVFEYYEGGYQKAEGWIFQYLEHLVYARHYNKPYAIVGMGANNLRIPNPIMRFIFKVVSNNASFIITRDEKSKNGFIVNGVKNPQLLACLDPVINYKKVKTTKSNKIKTIGILAWPFYMWPYFHSQSSLDNIYASMTEERKKQHKNFLKEFRKLYMGLKERGYNVIFPLFHFSDSVLYKELKLEKTESCSITNYFNVIDKCDLVISMRYHGQITSLLMNKPVISISVQEKMFALSKNFSMEENEISINEFDGNQVLGKIEKINSNYSMYCQTLYDRVAYKQNIVNRIYHNSCKTFFE